ncbi:hypothetical protein JOY44_22695 [Phormidium sp. CLA17]|uniref:hypothetical protein n=1 Tax=Leptolyngbya sp. Cla-17 TaxID=2803751 RepID=UPI001491E5D5|nr:hypothetical protein [Leptolyngbya sp. Cla-17]MBM0744384.1 hypothetical protein [Leptolyngbya sp. Cla-17]
MLLEQNVEMSQPAVAEFQSWHSQSIELIAAPPQPNVGYAKKPDHQESEDWRCLDMDKGTHTNKILEVMF